MEEMAGPLAQYGLWLVFGNVLLTQLGAPLPAIPTLIVAGALAQQGYWPAALVVALAIVACPDRRSAVVLRRTPLRLPRAEHPLSHLDGAGLLRAADRGRVRALGPAVAHVRQVRSRLRHRRAADSGCAAAAARALPRLQRGRRGAVGGRPRRRGRSLPRPGRSGAAAGRGDGRLRGARHSRDRGVLHRREVGGALSLPALHAHDAHQRAGTSRAHAGRSAAGHTRRAFGRCAHARSAAAYRARWRSTLQRRCCTRASSRIATS